MAEERREGDCESRERGGLLAMCSCSPKLCKATHTLTYRIYSDGYMWP